MLKHTDDLYRGCAPHTERNDCAVRALVCAVGIPYSQAWSVLQAEGRKPGRKTSVTQLANAILNIAPDTVTRYLRHKSMTVKAFALAHPEGHYLCMSRGHYFAVTQGLVHDWRSRPRAKVIWAWRMI